MLLATLLLTLAASSVTDQIERWSPVVLMLIAGGILYLRHRDRQRGPDEDDDEDW
ncbi:hypothetical protein GKE82_03530 [Conexibacter sp. W3-3-2]|uniref:hypothetical protein n=1 Tax=Solirubrobacterales TaxID=588673 RepID=UPI0012B7F98C|nr:MULTISPECIES: hypothetical protein [Solirubrobacterales]MTD43397.1 hypothetical protein [Conexibacter sp. W3-3-2]